jgi:hypothetical protein
MIGIVFDGIGFSDAMRIDQIGSHQFIGLYRAGIANR